MTHKIMVLLKVSNRSIQFFFTHKTFNQTVFSNSFSERITHQRPITHMSGIVSYYMLKTTKDKFSVSEDTKLVKLVGKSNKVDWTRIAKRMKNKTPRQCRERWNNYLNPNLKQGEWSQEEDELLMRKYIEIGAHWNTLAKCFDGRSANNVRNRYLTLERRNKKKSMLKQASSSLSSPNVSDITDPTSDEENSTQRDSLSAVQIGNIIDQIFSFDFTSDLFGSDSLF